MNIDDHNFDKDNIDKRLFERAVGKDEPPLTLDLAAIQAAGDRSRRRTRRLSVAAVAAAVVVIAGTVVVTTAVGQNAGPPVQQGPAAPASTGDITTRSQAPPTSSTPTTSESSTSQTASSSQTSSTSSTTSQTTESSVSSEVADTTAAPSDRGYVYCYLAPQLTASTPDTLPFSVVSLSGDDERGLGDTASVGVELCRDSLSRPSGDQSQGAGAQTRDWNSAPLVACVVPNPEPGESGTVVGVFPGTVSTCNSLGLPVAQL